MADQSQDSAQEPAGASRTPCSPCRGTGTVVSMLGGQRSELKCPWCQGTGVQAPVQDPQTRWAN